MRHPEFPDVPSTTELGIPDAEIPIWFSLTFIGATIAVATVASLVKTREKTPATID